MKALMRNRWLLLAASLILWIQVGAWAQEKYVPKDNEELYGTWTNEHNPKGDPFHAQKVVSTADRYDYYYSISDSAPYESGKQEIEAKWTDSEGNIWYKLLGTVTGGLYKGSRWQAISKLSKSGTVWERQLNPIYYADFSPKNYPTKIDPGSSYYRILFRAKE